MAKVLVNSAAIRKKDLVVVDGDLNVVEDALISVVDNRTGAYALIYNPDDKEELINNPFVSDSTGQFSFWVEAGIYKIGVTTQTDTEDLEGSVTVDVGNKGLFLTPYDFEAIGDGVADDSDAIEAWANSDAIGWAGGVFKITRPIYISSSKMVRGNSSGRGTVGDESLSYQASQGATIILMESDFVGEAGFIFKDDSTNSLFSCALMDMQFYCDGSDSHAVIFEKPYDNLFVRNLNILNIGANSSGMIIRGNPDIAQNEISQTILIENVMGIHKDETAISPTFYFDKCQEMTLIGLKAFGSYQTTKPACYPMHLNDCRGVTMSGCSQAHSTLSGIYVTSTTRASDAIAIVGNTFENLDEAGLKVRGAAAPNNVARVKVIAPRYQFPQNVAFNIDGADACEIDASNKTGTIGVSCKENVIATSNLPNITDNGTRNEIVANVSGFSPEKRYNVPLSSEGYMVAPIMYARRESGPNFQFLAGTASQNSYRIRLDADSTANSGVSYRHTQSGAIMEHQTDGDLRLVGNSSSPETGVILDDSSAVPWKIRIRTDGIPAITNQNNGDVAGESGTYSIASVNSFTFTNGYLTGVTLK